MTANPTPSSADIATPAYALRFSHLKQMAKSPAHYRAAVDQVASYDSPAMRLGRLVHSLVLGDQDGRATVVYDGERRGKAWQEFQAEHDGAEIVTRAEHDRAAPIAWAVMRDPAAATYLGAGGPRVIREGRILWTLDGRACSSTPDLIDLDAGRIIDLKTTQTAEPGRFSRLALAAHYHAQLAFYRRAVEAAHGVRARECVLVAVETSAPHPVTVLRLTDRALDEGDKLCRAWLERLAVCEAAGAWPGYTQAVLDLDCDGGFTLSIDGEEVEL